MTKRLIVALSVLAAGVTAPPAWAHPGHESESAWLLAPAVIAAVALVVILRAIWNRP